MVSVRVWVDGDICLGCGQCVESLPAVFRLDSDGIAEVIPDAPLPADLEPVRAAVRNCPNEAIHLDESA